MTSSINRHRVGATDLLILQGDITEQQVDALVNAANAQLMGGGGVDGAIHRAGGPDIMAECDQIRQREGGCPTGSAVVTTAGRLTAKCVIHTVGPIWGQVPDEEADQLLAQAYRSSLEKGVYHSMRSIAFPSISTGAYGFPIERAASIALGTVTAFLEEKNPPIEEVRFVLFLEKDLAVYQRTLALYLDWEQEKKS